MYKRDSLDSDLVEAIPAYPAKDGCLSRIPYSSVMAFVMCIVGVIMFAIMMIWSFNASVEQARRALDITNIPWLERVHLMFIIVAILMVIISVFLLIIGFLSTGSTREEVYKRADSRRGGRVICVLAMIFSYLLNILWMFMLSITAILSFVYYIFSDLCRHLHGYSEGNCLDFSVFRPLFQDVSHSDLKLCGGNAQEFCALTNTVFSWNIVGFVGAFIICLGLVQFLASNASNYAHVSNEQRYIELKEVLYLDNNLQEYPQPIQQKYYPSKRSWPSPPNIPPPMPRKQKPMDEFKRSRNHQNPQIRGQSNQMTNSTRRNSYQNSIHGSNPWLNQKQY
uniref:Tetraspanin n=1 Tax=Panagrolaimus sp. JU765 TaxID=591449 RepID=A0AC34QQ47_9BILA